MPLSSSVLPTRDEPTLVLRGGSVSSTFSNVPSLQPTLPYSGLPVDLPTAIQVPGYDIIRELGRGGMGVVYLARHRRLDRLVALKMVLARQYAGPDDLQRFRQEVEAVARLNHPNIAQVYEVGEHDGFAFAAFEYVEGGTLLRWQAEKPQDPQRAAKLLATIARAVQHAHDHGIIHRDLKPANILMGDADTPKITDFGLAKRLDGASNLTVSGIACGTPNYMAPEQIKGRHSSVGPSTDVYGLGAILFELLTAKPPFRGETPMSTMQAVLHEPPPATRKLREDVPHDLHVIVAKCLEKEPSQRYATARELADDLDSFLDDRPIRARGIGRVERSQRWVRRNPLATGLIASLALGLAVVLGCASILYSRFERERELRGKLEAAMVESDRAHERAEARSIDANVARSEAERNAAHAEAARKAAEASAANAAESLNLATASIDTVLARFATDPRFQDEDFLKVRQDLLRDATMLYQQLKQQSSNQAAYEYRSLRSQYFLGLLARASGKIDDGNNQIHQALTRFESLSCANATHAPWAVELAVMRLDDLERGHQDGSLASLNTQYVLQTARQSLNRARLANPGEPNLAFAQAKWLVMNAFVAEPARQWTEAEAAEATVDALFAAQPRDPEVVDLFGKLLLIQATALVQTGDLRADCYFEAAEEHYQKAAEVWFPSRRTTRWHVRYALTRQAHGVYLDQIGRTEVAGAAFTYTQQLLEIAIDSAPELANYRMDLAEAYLGIITRNRRLSPAQDPRPMCDTLDFRLAPFWNLGVPTDRARRTLLQSKLIIADWHEQRREHALAADRYEECSRFWVAFFKPGEGSFYNDFSRIALSRAAFQYAQARLGEKMLTCIRRLEADHEIPPGCWYNIARAWCTASTARLDPEPDLNRALTALRKAEHGGFFKTSDTRKHFQTAAELAPIRDRFTPKE